MKSIAAVIGVMCVLGAIQAKAGMASSFIREGLTTEDSPSEYEFRLMALGQQDGGNGSTKLGTLSEYIADSDWGFAYFKDVLGGDLEMRLDTSLTILDAGSGLDFPSQVGLVAVDTGLILGNKEDLSFEIRVAPGIYSDFEAFSSDAIDVPSSFALRQVAEQNLSAILGLQLRPRFADKVFPLAGIIWDPIEPVRVALCLPESRVTWQPTKPFRTYVGFEWQDMSYALRGDKKQLTLEDYILDAGLAVNLGSSGVGLEAEVGMMFNRTADFGQTGTASTDHVKVDSGSFIRVGMFGPL